MAPANLVLTAMRFQRTASAGQRKSTAHNSTRADLSETQERLIYAFD
jgi:hypothetical protein